MSEKEFCPIEMQIAAAKRLLAMELEKSLNNKDISTKHIVNETKNY